MLKKSMKLGNKTRLLFFLIIITSNQLFAEEKITTTPLINIEKIKPSFDELNEDNENLTINRDFIKKKTFT